MHFQIFSVMAKACSIVLAKWFVKDDTDGNAADATDI